MRNLHIIVVILCMASLTGISGQVALTCSGTDAAFYGEDDIRVVDGFPRSSRDDLVFVGSDQNVTVIDGTNIYSDEIGVCYSSSQFSCYKQRSDTENCDNFVRSATALNDGCTSDECRVLVCGTNALLPRCSFCDYNGIRVNCSFEENVPPQDLPYNSETYTSDCTTENINGEDIVQAIKNQNATILYENGKVYFGVQDNSMDNALAGLASVTEQGVFSGRVATRTDSQKMVAHEADFIGTPFINGNYAYFLFRESAQDVKSYSNGQDETIEVIYSRIARVCKDDAGVLSASSQIFTSFLKQRLNCSRDDEGFSVEYNEIQDFVRDGSMIYAIFTNERMSSPMSALCVFNLTDIDFTFNNGNFFGANGDNPNDLWQEYTGTAVTPRPGYDCGNPNTAAINFMRDYNQMNDPAVQTDPPFFLNGDRFSNLDMSNGRYIITSERGCLYQFNVTSDVKDLGSPCEDPLVPAPIKDLELVSNDGYLVTSGQSVYILNDCTEPEVVQPTACFSPPVGVGTYNVTPNSYFDIIYDVSCTGLSTTTLEDGTPLTFGGEEGACCLLKNESLDTVEMLVHLQILVLNESVSVTFSDSDERYIINPNVSYTTDQLCARCDDWEIQNGSYDLLTDSCSQSGTGTFRSNILLENNAAQDCSDCPYNGCTEACPSR